MALIDMSKVEQRYRAVLAVQAGERVGEVALRFGVSRQSVSTWLARYAVDGLAGLSDRSRRPESCPHQASPEVEAAVCELRRAHPRWGALRIEFELGRDGCPGPVPSRMTVYRILIRHGMVSPVTRRRGRRDYIRWQRDRPMELWQMDIVGGVILADGREVKVVTGVDDHSRYAVIAAVMPRATGRAVCLALAAAMGVFGIPQELLTDNGKQFTDRFGHGGEVLFDRICRENGIVHRLTAPRTPTTTGKVERFHQTLRRELLDDAGVFPDVAAAQTAIDGFRTEYNTRRPHQSLDMAFPVDRFRANVDDDGHLLLPLKLPTTLAASSPAPPAGPVTAVTNVIPAESVSVEPVLELPRSPAYPGGAVAFERVVPPSGNMQVAGKQFWIGTARSGVTVTFWADTDVIHLLIAGARVKSVRSHLSVNDLAVLYRDGGRPAGPPPLPIDENSPVGVIEVDRIVNRSGHVSLGQHIVLAAEILGGRPVSVRIDAQTLSFFDPDTRELLRTRPNPLTAVEIGKLRGARPAGPPPQPRTEPFPVQRRASNTGVIVIAGQKIALGRVHAGKTVTINVTDTQLVIACDDGPRTVTRTTTKPVNRIKADRPRIADTDATPERGK
jgi:transposase InsO family protein